MTEKTLDGVEPKEITPLSASAYFFFVLIAITMSIVIYQMSPETGRSYDIFQRELWVVPIFTLIGIAFSLFGLTGVDPNYTRVCDLFGEYKGNISKPGLYWVNPFYSCHNTFTGLRNHETDKIRCIEETGLPVDISVVFSYTVKDPANNHYILGQQSTDNHDAVKEFLKLNLESTLKSIAEKYRYDSDDEQIATLSKSRDSISKKIEECVDSEIDEVGVSIVSLKINHLSLPPEISSGILKKQQAAALLKARALMVEGVSKMVDDMLPKGDSADSPEYIKNRTNLMIALLSESPVHPTLPLA